jgi:acyl-coenzyme A synthetase/AMP-(fatty) acid ligase
MFAGAQPNGDVRSEVHQRDLAAENPGPQRVVEVIERGAELFAHRELIVTPDARLTYAEVDQASRVLAKRLIDAGIGKGARVATHLPHSVEWMVSFFAVTRIGAIFMPFSAAYKPAELRRSLLLGDVQLLLASTESWHGGSYSTFLEEALPELAPSSPPLRIEDTPFLREIWLFGDGDQRRWAEAVSVDDPAPAGVTDEFLAALEDEVVPADDAMIIWTSGTTADPKGAIHSQGTLARRAKANAYSHAFVAGDRVFCDYAFWWVGGPGYGFLPAIWAGATTLAVPKHSRETTETFLARERPTRVAGRLASDVAGRVMATDEGSGHMVTPRGIGMTETFGPHSMFDPRPLAEELAKPSFGLGPGILGFERKIIDPHSGDEVSDGEEGELLVRGPGMMRNLYRRERDEVFDADGWYHTGDRCVIVDGIIHFVSRYGEMIKTSGANVAPMEVELVLYAMPEVDEPVVFGMPDPERGEQVVAVVQRAPGADLDEDKVRDAVRSQLSNYKVPRHVVILDEADMPRLHSGKPDKRALQAMVAEALTATRSAK